MKGWGKKGHDNKSLSLTKSHTVSVDKERARIFASMKGGVRFYLAGAVMLLALAGCTHGTSVAVPGENSYAAAGDPTDDLRTSAGADQAAGALGAVEQPEDKPFLQIGVFACHRSLPSAAIDNP